MPALVLDSQAILPSCVGSQHPVRNWTPTLVNALMSTGDGSTHGLDDINPSHASLTTCLMSFHGSRQQTRPGKAERDGMIKCPFRDSKSATRTEVCALSGPLFRTWMLVDCHVRITADAIQRGCSILASLAIATWHGLAITGSKRLHSSSWKTHPNPAGTFVTLPVILMAKG